MLIAGGRLLSRAVLQTSFKKAVHRRAGAWLSTRIRESEA